MKNIKTFR